MNARHYVRCYVRTRVVACALITMQYTGIRRSVFCVYASLSSRLPCRRYLTIPPKAVPLQALNIRKGFPFEKVLRSISNSLSSPHINDSATSNCLRVKHSLSLMPMTVYQDSVLYTRSPRFCADDFITLSHH